MTTTYPSLSCYQYTEESVISPALMSARTGTYTLMTVPRSAQDPRANCIATKPTPQSRPTSPTRPVSPARERPRSLQFPLTASTITMHHSKPGVAPIRVPSFIPALTTSEPPPNWTSCHFGMTFHETTLEPAADPFTVQPSVLEGQSYAHAPSHQSVQGFSGAPAQNVCSYPELVQYSRFDTYCLGAPFHYEPISTQVPQSAASESWSPMQPHATLPLEPVEFAPQSRRQSLEMPRLRTAMACERCRVRKAKVLIVFYSHMMNSANNSAV
jgi:hypothetical protein